MENTQNVKSKNKTSNAILHIVSKRSELLIAFGFYILQDENRIYELTESVENVVADFESNL